MVLTASENTTILAYGHFGEFVHDLGMDEKTESALAIARKKAKLSQANLAKLAGTSSQQIDRLEKNQRKLTKEWAVRLAPYLDAPPESLVFSDLRRRQ